MRGTLPTAAGSGEGRQPSVVLNRKLWRSLAKKFEVSAALIMAHSCGLATDCPKSGPSQSEGAAVAVRRPARGLGICF